MEAKVVIAALKRVAPVAVEVQPRAAGHENRGVPPWAIVETLEVAPPEAILVELVEDPRLRARKLALQDALAMLRNVPAPVTFAALHEREGEGGLPHLPGSADEDHLAAEVPFDLRPEIAIDGHRPSLRVFSSIVKITREYFRRTSKTPDSKHRGGLPAPRERPNVSVGRVRIRDTARPEDQAPPVHLLPGLPHLGIDGPGRAFDESRVLRDASDEALVRPGPHRRERGARLTVMGVECLNGVVENVIEHHALAVKVKDVEPARVSHRGKEGQVVGLDELVVLLAGEVTLVRRLGGEEQYVRPSPSRLEGEASRRLGDDFEPGVDRVRPLPAVLEQGFPAGALEACSER